MILHNAGHVGVSIGARDWVLIPSFERLSALGSPRRLVELFGDLFGGNRRMTIAAAVQVIDACAGGDTDDLCGYHLGLDYVAGAMPVDELVLVARELIKSGMIGKPDGKAGDGEYSEEFDAMTYINAAVIHFGMTADEAVKLTMIQFQDMLAMKYPPENSAATITDDEYDRQYQQYLESIGAA